MTFSFIHFASLFYFSFPLLIVVMSLSPPHLSLFSSSLSASHYCRSLCCSLLQDNFRGVFRCFLHLAFCASRLPESQECFSLMLREQATKMRRKTSSQPSVSHCRLAYGTHNTQGSKLKCLQSFRVFIRRHSLSFLPLFPLRFL